MYNSNYYCGIIANNQLALLEILYDVIRRRTCEEIKKRDNKHLYQKGTRCHLQ